MFHCAECGGHSPKCDRCVAFDIGHLGGVAMSRGMRWAERVAVLINPRSMPWPPFEGKAKAIAERLVDGISSDDRVAGELARLCWADAERWWSMRRRG